MELKFDMPKVKSSIIKVLGVGGGGGNAVNHMHNQGIKGVEFCICNTDSQALEMSPIPNKIQLGCNLTEGRGAGSNPEIGKKAALESLEEVKKVLSNKTKMLFITAGMGGGTGTGAAPIIAQVAKDMGILTVAIVTTPFQFEGGQRQDRAKEGIHQLSRNVDTLLVISNEKLREMFGNLSLSSAFSHADNILASAAKGIAEIITVPGHINVDFEDVKTVMANSGAAIMGSAMADGKERAQKAAEKAIHSPLLSDNDIKGANYILLNITSGDKEVLMDEITTITDYIRKASGNTIDMIWGNCYDQSLGDKISVTVIATAFNKQEEKREEESATKEDTSPDKTEERTTEEKETGKKRQPTQMQFDFAEEDDKLLSAKNKLKEKEQEKENTDKEEELKELRSQNFNIRTSKGLEELEKVPAYKRKKVMFCKIPHSSETEISRYTLTEEKDKKKPKIKKKNSYLHDNVD